MTFVFDPAQACGVTKAEYTRALAAEHCSLGGTYAAVYKNPLLNLYDTTSPVPFRDRKTIQNYRALKLPNVEKAANETVLIMMHQHLLGTREYMNQWVQAIAKVNARLGQVKALCRKQAAGK